MRKRLLPLLFVAMTAQATAQATTPPEHVRPADQTFLTYPEWFLVFSPAEYAAFVRTEPPSRFPFFGHIRQFWQGYHAVWQATRGKYDFNAGYHLMIMVIGTSTTGEYAVRAVYETLVGRLAELTRRHGMTEEDRLGARVAQEYVDFIRVYPWYEFDFLARLKQLWTTTSFWGPDPIRKLERKYALTSEYAAKAIYGWMIKKATKGIYVDPLPTTAVVVSGRVVLLPRYEAFMKSATELARTGARFEEVAGNRGPILVSVLTHDRSAEVPYHVLLRQPILTQPGTERLLVELPVSSLAEALVRFDRAPWHLEHVYDF